MFKIIIRDRSQIWPFNEAARDLRVLNKPLWLYQRDILAPYCHAELGVESVAEIPATDEEVLVYRDNLFFDESLIKAFLEEARASGEACRIAFHLDDKAISTHAFPFQSGIRQEGDVYLADLWYFPRGARGDMAERARLVPIDTQAREIGYYHVPTYMATERGDLAFYVPLRAFLSIEHWVHVFMANSPFGIFAEGARMEASLDKPSVKLRILLRSLLERKQILSCSALVRVGKNVHIDPTAIIQGPTIIGDNVTIGPGVVISNCLIGNNVNIMQGCQLLLSVVSDGCYLPFRAALFMTTLMEDCMVAQNACLQLCVVGRRSFIGAGTTFTDLNLLPRPVQVTHKGERREVNLPVLGGCIGHNCRIGSGLLLYPGRAVESDTVLLRSEKRSVIVKDVHYEESDHHDRADAYLHPRLYPGG
jgi:carbonic anhydrase/acetyltransferase-like protein (isoleucine patch superfamily)